VANTGCCSSRRKIAACNGICSISTTTDPDGKSPGNAARHSRRQSARTPGISQPYRATPGRTGWMPADLLARRPTFWRPNTGYCGPTNWSQGTAGQTALDQPDRPGGLASAALATLLGNWTLGIGLAINLPLFDPSLDLEIKRTQVDQQIAEEEYRRTIIRAFEEVENALVNLANRKQQLDELERQLHDLRIVSNQVNVQLQAGLVSNSKSSNRNAPCSRPSKRCWRSNISDSRIR